MKTILFSSSFSACSYLAIGLMALNLMLLSQKAYGQSTGVAAAFLNPEAEYRPHIRMWIPQAAIDESVLRAHVNDLADTGFGDIELVAFDFAHNPPGRNLPASAVSVEEYGWGTPNWTKTMQTLLDQAGKKGIKATFTIGPAWPVASPLLTKKSPGVEVQLACTRIDVPGNSYSGEVTGNIFREDVSSKLVAVIAGKRMSGDTHSELDMNTLVDLTKSVKSRGTEQYDIDWTAPDNSGQWSLYFYWCEPVGEKKSGFYVVDHFSMEGTTAVLNYYKTVFDILKKMNLLQYLKGLFGDSLEYRASNDWTVTFLDTFKELKGYDLALYLPAINNGIKTGGGGIFGGGFGKESFGGVGQQILNDYYDVLTNLFNENHLKPMQHFMESYGQNLRYQTAYGKYMEQAGTSMNVSIPEGEMMMIRNSFDNLRAQAGAVHMTDKIEYNAELQAEMGKNHAQSWENLLFFIQRAYSVGVNNVTLHGYNYNGKFSGPGNVNGHLPNVLWPGWEGFGRDGFSNSWGTEPLWKYVKDYTGFMARNGFILKQGKARIDLAVFRESFWDNAGFDVKDGDVWYKDGAALQDMGYSYDFVGLPNLKLPNATVEKGRLDAQGPSYKAIILDQSLNTLNQPVASTNKSIRLEAAQKILQLAKAGLPVVYISELPLSMTYYSNEKQSDAKKQLQAIISELKELPNVKQAKTHSEVPAVLASLGISPDAQYSLMPHQPKLINIHRAAEGIDYYYLYNRGFNSNSGPAYEWNYGGVKEQAIQDVTTQVLFKATGKPYFLDAWTGTITPVANYTINGENISIPLNIRGNESKLIAFDHGNILGVNNNSIHAGSAGNVNLFYDRNGNVALKALNNGQQSISMSNGSIKKVDIAGLSAPITLSNWKLKVEDWKPGNTPTETNKSTVEIDLGDLKPWHTIPALQNVSGIGTYSTTFSMDKGWEEGVGAYIDLGIVNFAYKLVINGEEIKSSQLNTRIDIGPYIKPGSNTVIIEVATTLNNRLKDFYSVAQRTIDYYGLIGSGGTSATNGLGGTVVVIPYIVTPLK